jgi:hypothetical protein
MWLVTPAPVVPELVVRLCAGSALLSWRGDAGYSRGTETAVVEVDPEGLARMAVHEEPNGGERGRAVADRVPPFSLFGAEVISSVGNNITTLAVPYVAVR